MGAYANPIYRPSPSGSNDGSGSDLMRGGTFSMPSPSGTSPSGGANQFFGNIPTMPNPYGSGAPPTGMGGYGSQMFPNPYSGYSGDTSWLSGGGVPGASTSGLPPAASNPLSNDQAQNIGHGIMATGLQYPGFSSDFTSFLKSQIGQGTPANPLLAQLIQFFQGRQGGSTLPGSNTLSTIANQGISALPEWQSMIAAMQHNIGENQANLKEQFAGMGDLAGSPFGTAMSDYMTQTNLDQNALLGQLQQTNILQGQIPVAQALLQGAGGMGEFGQSLLPQNNPLLPLMQGMATLYPPTTKTPTTWDMVNSTIGALSGAGFSSGGSGFTL